MFFKIFPQRSECPLGAAHGSISLRYVAILVIPIDSIVGQVNKVVLDICMMLVILLSGKPNQPIFVEVQPIKSDKKYQLC